MAGRTQTNSQDQQQRDAVTRIDITLSDVIQPALKSLQVDVKTIVQKDYLTKAEADVKYVTKSDFRPYQVILGTIGTVILGAIALAIAKGFLK